MRQFLCFKESLLNGLHFPGLTLYIKLLMGKGSEVLGEVRGALWASLPRWLSPSLPETNCSYKHASAPSLNYARGDCTYPLLSQITGQMWQVKYLTFYFRVSPLYQKKKKLLRFLLWLNIYYIMEKVSRPFKNVCSAVVWSIPHVPDRFNWIIVFVQVLPLYWFCLVVLFITENT